MNRRPGVPDAPMRYARDWHHIAHIAIAALAVTDTVALAVGLAVIA